MNVLLDTLTLLTAGVVTVRCFCVIRKMQLRGRSCSYPRFLGFGVAYAVLMTAALWAAIELLQGSGGFRDLMWLAASAGLILFDRRRRRDVKVEAQP